MVFASGELERLYLHSEVKQPIEHDCLKFRSEDERRILPPKNDESARSVALLATQVATKNFEPMWFPECPSTPAWVSEIARVVAFKASQVAV